MRAQTSGKEFDLNRLSRVGLTEKTTKELYRLLAIAKYEDRFVIPTSHKEEYLDVYRDQGTSGFSGCNGCSLSGDGMGSNNSPDVKTSNQSSYEESFYGGIWRD
jgi:nitrate reductase beta subunit